MVPAHLEGAIVVRKSRAPFTAAQTTAIIGFSTVINGVAFAITGLPMCAVVYLLNGIAAAWWWTYGRAIERR